MGRLFRGLALAAATVLCASATCAAAAEIKLLNVSYDPTREQLMEINLTLDQVRGKQFFYGEGCDTCGVSLILWERRKHSWNAP